MNKETNGQFSSLRTYSSVERLCEYMTGSTKKRGTVCNLEKMKFTWRLKSKSKLPQSTAEKTPKHTNIASVASKPATNCGQGTQDDQEIQDSFIQKSKEFPQDLCRHFVREQLTLIENFEREKEDLIKAHENEKKAIRKAYENERKDLIAEVEKLRKLVETNCDEIRVDFEARYYKQIEDIKQTIQKEHDESKTSLHEQWVLVADIEAELKRIGEQMLGILQTLSPEEASGIDSNLKSKLSLDKSCLASLRKIFDTQAKPVRSKDVESDGVGDKQVVKQAGEPLRDLETTYNRDLDDLTSIFRRQKSEIVEMFASEKEELQRQLEDEKKTIKDDMEIKYQQAMATERKEWQDTIREYQREIDILRYQRDQMDRNYCIELDNMKMEFENEKVCLYKKFMKERDSIKRNISDKISHALFADVQRGSDHK